MVFDDYTKRRILYFRSKGYCAGRIVALLAEEGIVASRMGVHDFLVQACANGSITRWPGRGRLKKWTEVVKAVVETAMRADDETTAKELQKRLSNAGHCLSESTALRCRRELGWTVRGSAYCQLISRHEQ